MKTRCGKKQRKKLESRWKRWTKRSSDNNNSDSLQYQTLQDVQLVNQCEQYTEGILRATWVKLPFPCIINLSIFSTFTCVPDRFSAPTRFHRNLAASCKKLIRVWFSYLGPCIRPKADILESRLHNFNSSEITRYSMLGDRWEESLFTYINPRQINLS